MSTSDPQDDDPRKARSRARLLEAAASLLGSGGPEAITIDAVTRLSGVARTTLYRHFENVVQLRAATLEQIMPPVVRPPTEGSLRDRLVELLTRQAEVINEAPFQLTVLAWLATAEHRDDDPAAPVGSLRQRVIDQHRRPFDDLLASDEGRAVFDGRDPNSIAAQLIGPIIFPRLTGVGEATSADCARIVDDLLAACAARGPA